MKKRTLSLILAVLIILPAVFSVGVIFEKNSFSIFDIAREDALLNAVSGFDGSETYIQGDSVETKYIVRFNSDASLSKIEKALNNIEYSLLAESEKRLFAVSADEKFFADNQEIIEYYEPDLARTALMTTDDPEIIPMYEKMGVYTAWDKKTASGDIVVAVLDTGVARSHEDLLDVNILAGYDAVSGKSGVNGDTAGHGTGVVGLIAATANNALGIAGIANGVSILPVKVSATGTTIYSSDLIRGIHFAADAGAKIINMSVGGYSSSYAEQDAVKYALSKGCILISAAGNGGNGSYADQKSYPASYEGVISVASCDDSGKRSSFSQYNESVDIAAYGENIPMPFVDENGVSGYKIDSGTSFSCAFVSGIAALAASVIGKDARFEAAEFESLLIECCGSKKTNEQGFGIINADKIVSLSAEPIITGVYDGGKFSESLRVGFNRGTATLNGESIEDGEIVLTNGNHKLSVVDGEKQKNISFRLNYNPLSYEFLEFVSFAYFEFERGTAFLDGFPYSSGEKITAPGRHTFILEDGDERLEKQINLRYSLPTVIGVADGKSYDHAVEIKIIGDGKAELDGKTVGNSFSVYEKGNHILKLTSGSGVITEEITFTLNTDLRTDSIDIANAKAAVDEENGFICFYADSLVGIRINDLEKPENYLQFLPVGKVYSHRFTETELWLYGEKGITVIDRKTAKDGEKAIIKKVEIADIENIVPTEDSYITVVGRQIFVHDNELDSDLLLAELDFDCERIFYHEKRLVMLSPTVDSIVRVLDIESGVWTEYDLGSSLENAKIVLSNGILGVDNRLYDVLTGEFVLGFSSGHLVGITDDYVFTDLSVIDINSGDILGCFPYQISDIVFGAKQNYIFGTENKMSRILFENRGIYGFCASEPANRIFSDTDKMNEYHTNAFFDKNVGVRSAVVSENMIFAVADGENAIFSYDIEAHKEQTYIPLKFKPSAIFESEGRIIVCFDNKSALFVYEIETKNGFYVETPSKCSSAVFFGNTLYLASGGVLCSADIATAVVTPTEIPAEYLASDSERLYVVGGNTLTSYGKGLNVIATASVKNNEIHLNGFVTVGTSIYDRETLAEVAKLDSPILAIKNDTAVTQTGIYSINEKGYIGKTETPKARIVLISSNNTVVTFGDGEISFCSYGDGSDVSSIPDIKGIENEGIYTESATISYKNGIGYLDGKPIKSGENVSEIGTHEFILVLPCGRTHKIDFAVSAKLSRIEFVLGNRIMSIGEKITLELIYLPEGARSVPAEFYCDKAGISISKDGEVTASEVGDYSVFARVKTDSGTLEARCSITVRVDLISVPTDGGLRVLRNNGLLLDILPATTAEELLAGFAQKENLSVIGKDGNPVEGFIGTGDKIVLKVGDIVTDELCAVVHGDTDGDGYLSANDLYLLKSLLRGNEYEDEVHFAADLNHSGDLTNGDYRELSRILLGRTAYPVGIPEKSPFGHFSVETVSTVVSGEYVDIAIVLNGMKYAKGAYGRIDFGNGLEFVEFDSEKWEADCYTKGGELVFYAFSEDGRENRTAYNVVLTARFRVNAKAGDKLNIKCDGIAVSLRDGLRMVKFEESEFDIVEHAIGEFNIEIKNAHSFVFNPKINEYEIVIPYDNAIADLHITREENQTVSISSLAVPSSGKNTVTVGVANQDGTVAYYNISIIRGEPNEVTVDCKLSDLEIEGIKLKPSFSPDFYEYSVFVPHDTEKLNIYAVARSDKALVFIDDTTLLKNKTVIDVTVAAPDGESLVYKVTVTKLPPPVVESSSEETTEREPVSVAEPMPKKGISSGAIALIVIAVVAGLACVVFYIRKNKE